MTGDTEMQSPGHQTCLGEPFSVAGRAGQAPGEGGDFSFLFKGRSQTAMCPAPNPESRSHRPTEAHPLGHLPPSGWGRLRPGAGWGSQSWPGHDKGLSGWMEGRARWLRILGLSGGVLGGPVSTTHLSHPTPVGQCEPAANTTRVCTPTSSPQPNQPSSVSGVGSDPQARRPLSLYSW